MRYLAVALLLFVRLMVAAQPAAVHFESGDWAALQVRASQDHRPVFLYFWSPSCGPCIEMARDVFPDSAVARYYNTTFRSFKVNRDSEEGKALGTQYGIQLLPAYLYFGPEAQLLHRSVGGKPAAEFIQDGRDAFNPDKAYYTLKARYEAGERSPAFLYAFSTAPGVMGEPALSRRVSDEYLQTQSTTALASSQNQDYIFNQYQGLDAAATQYFLRHQPAFSRQFGAEAVAKRTRNIISQAADEDGRKNDAAALGSLKQTVTRLMPTKATQWQQLVQIHYLLGQPTRDWPAYADAALAYGRKFAARDSYTLYEATVYMTAFVKDKAVLAKADQLIQLALAVDPSALYLLTRAKLLHKLGDDTKAATVAREAVLTATRSDKNSEDATSFLAEIGK